MERPKPYYCINNELISYIHSGIGPEDWVIHCRDIAVFGEYTDSNGPYLDDYWLVFILKDGSILTGSFYGNGINLVNEKLSSIGFDVEYSLCDSADFNSNVIFPICLRGLKLYEFNRIAPSGGFFRRLFFSSEISINLTPAVISYLKIPVLPNTD